MPRGNLPACLRQHTKDVMCIDMVEKVFGISRRTIFNRIADGELEPTHIMAATFIKLNSLLKHFGKEFYNSVMKTRAQFNEKEMIWEYIGSDEVE